MLFDLLFMTDMQNEQAFAVNPALAPSGKTTLAYVQSSGTMNSSLSDSGDQSKITAKREYNKHGAQVLADFGKGMTLGVYGTFDKKQSRNYRDTSRYRNLSLDENDYTRELGGTLKLDLTSNFTLGIQIRAQSVSSDFVGTFNADETDRLHLNGNLYGGGAGVAYSDNTWKLAACYYIPQKGKISAGTESFVSTESGMILAQGAIGIKKGFNVAGGYALWTHEKDDLLGISVTPDAGQRMFLRGAYTEKYYFRDQTFLLGTDFWITNQVGVKAELRYEYGFYAVPASPPAAPKVTDKNRLTTQEARAAIELKQGAVMLNVGGAYARRNDTKTENNNKISHVMSDFQAFVKVQAGI